MNVQISSVNMRYSDGVIDSVQVHFNGNDEDRTISVRGYISLTAEEYQGKESVQALEVLVRQHVSEKILIENDAE